MLWKNLYNHEHCFVRRGIINLPMFPGKYHSFYNHHPQKGQRHGYSWPAGKSNLLGKITFFFFWNMWQQNIKLLQFKLAPGPQDFEQYIHYRSSYHFSYIQAAKLPKYCSWEIPGLDSPLYKIVPTFPESAMVSS